MATAALIGAGVSAAGAIGSSIASNKGNANIAQQGNAFNEKMLQKQMDYNTQMYQQQLGDQWQFYNDAKQNSWDMFNATNEYNSASAQRARLEAAGLNPYLMMSGGNAGTATAQASSQASSPSAQGVTPPTATPDSTTVVNKNNYFGYNRALCSAKLMECLGYGNLFYYAGSADNTILKQPLRQNLYVSLFNLLAYQKIYSDYYRDSQWERVSPSCFNVD